MYYYQMYIWSLKSARTESTSFSTIPAPCAISQPELFASQPELLGRILPKTAMGSRTLQCIFWGSQNGGFQKTKTIVPIRTARFIEPSRRRCSHQSAVRDDEFSSRETPTVCATTKRRLPLGPRGSGPNANIRFLDLRKQEVLPEGCSSVNHATREQTYSSL